MGADSNLNSYPSTFEREPTPRKEKPKTVANTKNLDFYPSTFEPEPTLSVEERVSQQYEFDSRKKRATARAKFALEGVKAKRKQWITAAVCPVHNKPVFVIVTDMDQVEAKKQVEGKNLRCQYGNHMFEAKNVSVGPLGKYTMSSGEQLKVKPFPFGEHVSGFGNRGVLTTMAVSKAMKTVVEAPTVLESYERRTVASAVQEIPVTYMTARGPVTEVFRQNVDGGEIIKVAIRRADQLLVLIYTQNEVRLFDSLFSVAQKAKPYGVIKNGLLALLLVHGGATKTQITGFLKAANVPGVSPSSVGEALSRLKNMGVIYTKTATLSVKPPEPTEKGRVKDTSIRLGLSPVKLSLAPRPIAGKGEKEQVLGEPFYFLDESTRQRVLHNFKTLPGYAWWDFYKGAPALRRLRLELKYEWVRIVAPVAPFKSKEDLLRYGPFKPGEIKKLPVADALNLQQLKQAELLNKNAKNQPRPKLEPKRAVKTASKVDVRSRRLDLMMRRG